eukprot:TRINITY_DN704_c0_g3_i1.p1 TRINITY_DN704_c0_g3~~TRINITY_DN704_c0_g3_i1.p1  ORF type:complete len:261 (-),score=88.08 TRINITY_DN704_c0_g3_i1:163-945(-)
MSIQTVEEFLECINEVPKDVKRNFALIREIDEQCHHKHVRLNQMRDAYIDHVHQVSKLLDQKDKSSFDETIEINNLKEEMNQIDELEKVVSDLAAEKVNISSQIYTIVENGLKELEDRIGVAHTIPVAVSPVKRARKPSTVMTQAAPTTTTAVEPEATTTTTTASTPQPPPVFAATTPAISETRGFHDEEENQTYCICKGASHGEMIGCDGANCLIEWFHFECVGVKPGEIGPDQKWYCPDCQRRIDDSKRKVNKKRKKS